MAGTHNPKLKAFNELKDALEARTRELEEVKQFHAIIEQGWQEELKNLDNPYTGAKAQLWDQGSSRASLLKVLKLWNKIQRGLIQHLLKNYKFSDKDVDLLYEQKITNLLNLAEGELQEVISQAIQESGISLEDTAS